MTSKRKIGRRQPSDDKGHGMLNIVLFAVIAASAVFVAIDARGRDFSTSRFAPSVLQWVIGVVLLWLIVFPAYMFSRVRHPRVGEQLSASQQARQRRTAKLVAVAVVAVIVAEIAVFWHQTQSANDSLRDGLSAFVETGDQDIPSSSAELVGSAKGLTVVWTVGKATVSMSDQAPRSTRKLLREHRVSLMCLSPDGGDVGGALPASFFTDDAVWWNPKSGPLVFKQSRHEAIMDAPSGDESLLAAAGGECSLSLDDQAAVDASFQFAMRRG